MTVGSGSFTEHAHMKTEKRYKIYT